MNSQPAGYTGADNLEIMREAVNYNAWLLRLISRQARPDARVLDFGAGAGTFALPLHQAGVVVTCLEPDAALASSLRAAGLPVVTHLDEIREAAFDLIYTLNVLEHIEDDRSVLAGLRARLQPGGRLLVYVPAFELLFSSMDRKVGHVRRYRRADLVARVREAGFQIETARYVDSLGFFAALLFRLMDRGTGALDGAQVRQYDRWVLPLSLICDRVLWRFFGKNLSVVAVRPRP